MMNPHPECPFREEEVIDILLHNGSQERRHQLERHVEQCGICRQRLREWGGLLNGFDGREVPSQSVWKKLRLASIWSSMVRKGRSKLTQRRGLLVFSSVAMLVLCVYFGIFMHTTGLDQNPVGGRNLENDNEILQDMGMIMKAKTSQYPVISLEPGKTRGVAWINSDDSELLLLVEGLPNDPNEDYQVWSNHADSHVQLGTLRLAEGKAHLHYRGSELNAAETISICREHKGLNSRSAPTAPDLMTIKVK